MVGIIIQARVNSRRFPNKVLAKVGKKTVLEMLISRVKRSKNAQKIILATTENATDNKLINIARKQKIAYFRGDEEDVLSRVYFAAKKNAVDAIVRITGDCPFIDWNIIDKAIEKFVSSKNYDYVSNVHPPTFPDGMDIEVFSFSALEKAYLNSKLKSEREHVTPYIWKRPRIFKQYNLRSPVNNSRFRITLDEKRDLLFLRLVHKSLGGYNFLLGDILNLLKQKPELTQINSSISRNEGYSKSLREDVKNNNN